MEKLAALRIRQLDRGLDRVRKVGLVAPRSGWIASLREALGMSQAQLGKRLGLPRQGVHALEARESLGTITLNTLRDAAAALDAEVVYAIVPRRPLAAMLEAQAQAKAEDEYNRVAHSMWLEDQATDTREARHHIAERAEELLRTMPRSLWDTDGP